MAKLLKWLGITVGVLVLIVVIAIVALITFVSPNRFKPIIIDQVKKNTGRDLVMDGDLSWTFFPTLGVKAGHMQLSNPEGFQEKTFAEIANMTVSVKVLPLLHGKVESSGIKLAHMKLNLIKNASGVTNWAFPASIPSQTTTTVTTHSSNDMTTTTLGLAVSEVDVNDANVNWIDEQTKQTAVIDHFNFHAKDISLMQSFPIAADFDFSANNPALSGHLDFGGQAGFSLQKQLFFLRDVAITTQLEKANKTYKTKVTGDLSVDLQQQTLQWTNFKANAENLNLTGNINVTHLNTTPETTGHVAIQPFDLKELLQSLGQDTSNLQMAKDVRGDINFSVAKQGLVARGKFIIDEVTAAKLKLTHLTAEMRFQDNTLDLLPIKADLYQGTLDAQAHVNLKSVEPQMMLQAQLRNVQSEPLLQDLRGKQKFTLQGAGNVDLQMTTSGVDGNTIVKNLNGTTHINFSNGALKGLDLGYLIDSASAALQKQSGSATNSDQTNFGNLSASAVIRNGVLSNDDLLIDSPRFTTKGKGTIDLVNQRIDYSLQATVKQQNNPAKTLAGITIPVYVKGSLNDPSIRLDTGALFKSVAEQQLQQQKGKIEQKIQDQIQNRLGVQLPGNAGDALKSLLGH